MKSVSTVGLACCVHCGVVLKADLAKRKNDGDCPVCGFALDPGEDL